MKVLVVDDDAVSLLVLHHAVETLGHTVRTAAHGEEAWSVCQQWGPDVVITDWLMPHVDGLELCRRIRAAATGGASPLPGTDSALPPYTYVVLETSLTDQVHQIEAMRGGADDFLPKPLDPLRLEACLLAAERVTRLHRQLHCQNLDLQRQKETLERRNEEFQTLTQSARCLLWHALITEEPDGEDSLRWERTLPLSHNVPRLLPIVLAEGEDFFAAWEASRLPEDRLRCERIAREAIRAGHGFSCEHRYRSASGEVRWVHEDVQVEVLEAGRRWRAVGVCMDITDMKRLQAQILHADKLAALGEMVAGVAHEINNPLAAISGMAQLLQVHPDPSVGEDARAIRAMVDRASRIVKSLRLFAWESSVGDMERRAPGEIGAVIEAALDLVRYKLNKSTITLTIKVEPDLPLIPMAVSQIEQVLLNLLNNAEHALRCRPYGEREITIRASRLPDTAEEDGIALAVTDNGCGIPDEVRDRIFDPFFTTKDVGEGTGLGLSICHGIAEAHGGQITVESQVGVGTTFTLLLPHQTGAVTLK